MKELESMTMSSLSEIADEKGYRLVPKHHPVRGNIPKNLKATSVKGWFSEHECYELYLLTLLTEGPILEIGHFLGRSTACICEALHDSGKKRDFYSYDLGFRTPEEFKEFYDKVHKRETPAPQEFRDFVFSKNVTSTQVAGMNLKNLGLDHLVNLISGNFIALDQRKYSFIFCDAVHEPNEIALNLPHVIERSGKNCIWAFHDMKDANVQCVLSHSNAVFLDRVHSLGIFMFKGAA